MIGYLIRLAFGWNFILRWNNFPRVEDVTEVDNLWMVLHTSLILSFVLESKWYGTIDRNYIFKRIFLWSFVTFVLSDINSDVKNRIKQKDFHIYKELTDKIYSFLLSWDIPDKIKSDIKFISVVEDGSLEKDYSLEEKLITFSKLYVARDEAYYNSSVYGKVYEKVLTDINKRLQSKDYEIFREVFDEKINKYLISIRKLIFLYRWNRLRRNYSVSVMSHMYFVSFLSYIIWVLEEKTDEEILEMMYIGLYHDISEAVTWDIVSPVKKSVPGFDELLSSIEKELVREHLLEEFEWEKFCKNLDKRITQPFESKLWELVKVSDIFSALFEARLEWVNNSEFDKIYTRLKRLLNNKNLYSVDYLLKFGVDYFDLDLEDFLEL